MDKKELIRNIQDDIEAFGEDKEVFVQWAGQQPVDYSYIQEGKCIDPESLGNLFSILTDD